MSGIQVDFWRGKKVLITGHTGFKGSWLSIWLNSLGAQVSGISLDPSESPNLYDLGGVKDICASYYCDINNSDELNRLVNHIQPEIVFHLAAQAIVQTGYIHPVSTFSTNVLGTVNLLECLRTTKSIKVGLMITTDKVYKNNEWDWPYREIDELGGIDPYSASKAAMELVVGSYYKSFFFDNSVAISSARAGNVIGGGDWSKYRLIPDAIRQWSAGEILDIRAPNSVRPWQHVLDPLAGYLILAERMWQQPEISGAYNFGPNEVSGTTVREVVEKARNIYGKGEVNYLKSAHESFHDEAKVLQLDVNKSKNLLGYRPKWDLGTSISKTINWYSQLKNHKNAYELCLSDIDSYLNNHE
jgi:CDP-glucose 4,6-dehydratase